MRILPRLRGARPAPGLRAGSTSRVTGEALPTAACLALCALATTTACSTGTGDAPGHVETVRAVILPFLSQAPMHVAAREGYFADEGLEVEFVHLPRTQEIMATLSRGDVDAAGAMPGVSILNSIVAGEPLRLVATLGHLAPRECSYYAWLTRPELLESGALADPRRVREMRFGANVYLSEAYWLAEALRPLGLGLDDVELVDVPPAATAEAVRSGAVDVAALSEPLLGVAAASPDLAIWQEAEDLVPDQAISVVVFGPRLSRERPEIGERFLAAVQRGIRQFQRGKTPRNVAIVRELTGLSAGQVRDTCWPTAPTGARIDPGQLRGYQEWAVGHGLLERVLAADELLDNRFVEAASARLAR